MSDKALFVKDSTIEANKTHALPVVDTISISEKPILPDTSLNSLLSRLGIDSTYRISTSHKKNLVEGYFTNDEDLDSAILVENRINHKYGLLIKMGGSTNYTLLGAGKEVLGQQFDDLEWVGILETVLKGEKVASNIDEETGEIRTNEIPDHEKTTLPRDGIYIHQLESCGGGIIYLEEKDYKWIQQE